MSRKDSHLSSDLYQSDIVVAITEAALNNQAIEYLQKHTFDEFVVFCFEVWDKESGETFDKYIMTKEEGLKACDDIDPFVSREPKDMTDETVANLETLDRLGFKYAFRTKLGIPKDVDPDDLTDLISIKYSNERAIFTLKFECFEVADFTAPNKRRNIPGYTKIREQTADSQFDIELDVGFQNIDFDESKIYLDSLTQKKLKQLGDKGFSIEQLVFNFSQHSVIKPLTIPNIKKSISDKISNMLIAVSYTHLTLPTIYSV